MITGYRIVKERLLDSAFDGEGAKRYGGRWNSRGKRCVYLAESISLALLEVLVHLDDARVLAGYRILSVNFKPKLLMNLAEDALPEDWSANPAPISTAFVGDAWLDSQASAVLAVPSAIVPLEHSFLLNPAHPDAHAVIESADVLDLAADARLQGFKRQS